MRNRFESNIYIRPFMYKAAEDVGVRLHNVPDAFAIVPVPVHGVSRYDERRCTSASVRGAAPTTRWHRRGRRSPDCTSTRRWPRAKRSRTATTKPILLSHDGHVAEGSAENFFLVRRGVLYTPDPSQNVLEGCTRRAIMDIARDRVRLEVVERSIDRGELYCADEVFFTGTASGIAHVASVDRRVVGDGSIGTVTRQLADFYESVVTGREPRYSQWLTRTYASARVNAVGSLDRRGGSLRRGALQYRTSGEVLPPAPVRCTAG